MDHRQLSAVGARAWQFPNTDVAIYTTGDTMLLKRKKYTDSGHTGEWMPAIVPLHDGSLFLWKTGEGSDDWEWPYPVP